MRRLSEAAKVISNRPIGTAVFELILFSPDIAAQAQPGQFIHLKLNSLTVPLLRRPLSIAGANSTDGSLTIIYRVVGQGTALLSRLKADETVDCLGPLGQGFSQDVKQPLLIGGGMGLAPLVFLASELCPKPMTVLMGGRTKDEMFWTAKFDQLCRHLRIATNDGSLGEIGLVTDLLPNLLETGRYDMVYTCGPRPMMEIVAAIAKKQGVRCQVSLEEYMACGVGGCLACTCAGTDGKRRKICTEGPVFWAEEVFSC